MPARQKIPLVVCPGIDDLSLTTSEFTIAGMMPLLSVAFSVPIAEVGYLISIYAARRVVGGPLLTTALLKPVLQTNVHCFACLPSTR